MKKNTYIIIALHLILLSGCILKNNKPDLKNIHLVHDMAKRELMVSKQINKVISNGPVGSVLLYTIANEKMAARNFAATTYEKLYCTKKYCELPIVGCWYITNGTRSVENIINIKPDLIISAGNITRNTIENTQEDQRLMDIPIAIISTEFTELPLSYSLLGDLLNEQEKAKELIDFYNKYIPGIIHKTSLIPDNEKKGSIWLSETRD